MKSTKLEMLDLKDSMSFIKYVSVDPLDKVQGYYEVSFSQLFNFKCNQVYFTAG